MRRLINSEDKCDIAIKNELEKGPKRIRVASREELKMDINKYKNMTLKLMEELKKHGIKQPLGIKVDMNIATGMKEKEHNADILSVSNADEARSQLGNVTNAFDEGGKGNEALLEDRNRLEEEVTMLNQDLASKNDKILELLDELEEMKI